MLNLLRFFWVVAKYTFSTDHVVIISIHAKEDAENRVGLRRTTFVSDHLRKFFDDSNICWNMTNDVTKILDEYYDSKNS